MLEMSSNSTTAGCDSTFVHPLAKVKPKLTSSSVLPVAIAFGCAKKFAMSSSWFSRGAPSTFSGFWLQQKPMNSHGI